MGRKDLIASIFVIFHYAWLGILVYAAIWWMVFAYYGAFAMIMIFATAASRLAWGGSPFLIEAGSLAPERGFRFGITYDLIKQWSRMIISRLKGSGRSSGKSRVLISKSLRGAKISATY
ncbi:MAG TPA: hypothetical protein VI953_00580 [Candidatus Paceibacterota bacterium]